MRLPKSNCQHRHNRNEKPAAEPCGELAIIPEILTHDVLNNPFRFVANKD